HPGALRRPSGPRRRLGPRTGTAVGGSRSSCCCRSLSWLLRSPFVSCADMAQQPKKIFVAVAWPYASGARHIGHVAGFGVPSDTFARYNRLRGNDVLMVSGTDEHGTPVMVAADAAGESPRETAERFSGLIREDLRNLGLAYD